MAVTPRATTGRFTQFDGYTRLASFDLDGYAACYGNIGRLDLILAAEGNSPNRYQIGKQADVLMLLYLLSAEELRDLLADLGYHWPKDALPRTVDFYSSRVSHGSTLSHVVHSWVDLAERCYLGIEVRDDALWLNPQLPHHVSSLHTLLIYRDHRLHVAATRTSLTLAASPCEAAPVTVHTPTRRVASPAGNR